MTDVSHDLVSAETDIPETQKKDKEKALAKRVDKAKGTTPWWVTRDMAEEFGREAVLITTLRAALIYIIYFISVVMCTLYRRHEMMFYFAEALKGQFLSTEFKTTNDASIVFEDIKTVVDFWHFSQSLLLDSLYPNAYYSDPNLPVKDMDDLKILHENLVLGVPRIRQVKVRNDSCDIHEYFRLLFKGCYDIYNMPDEAKSPFGKRKGTAWVYQDPQSTGSIPFTGQICTYDGGGYYQDLSTKKNESLKLIKDLYDHFWITRGTRAVFIDFTIYNGNMNLFCLCKFIFEFPHSGGVLPSSRFAITFLDVGFNSHYKTGFCVECILYIMGAIYLFEEVREIWFFRLKYFSQFWSYMDLTLIALIIANLVTSVILFPNVYAIIEDIIEHRDKYGNLEYVGALKSSNNSICALLLFFSFIKFFKYLKLNRTTGQLNNTLKKCVYDIFCFTVMFMIVFTAYAELGYLLFGGQCEDYSSLGTAMLSLLRAILGDFDYQSLEDANRILAPVYFLSYIFLVFFVLMNVFLAIINDTYSDVKTEISIAPREMEITDYLKKRILKLLDRLGFRISEASKSESKVTIQDLRRAFRQCGYKPAEIDKFFAKYTEGRSMNNDQLLKVIEIDANAAPKIDDSFFLRLSDFVIHKKRLIKINNSLILLLNKCNEPLRKLEKLEREMEELQRKKSSWFHHY